MNRVSSPIFRATALAFGLAACAVSPESGKSRVDIIPDSFLNSMGATAYAESTGAYPEITSGPQYEMVRRVTERITDAAQGYAYEWEFKLLDAPDTVNAFALPGGKIAVYTGLLRVATTEDQLAAVIGHEIAHVTEEHGQSRILRSVGSDALTSMIAAGTDAWLSDPDSKAAVMGAFGLGTEYGIQLPFGRQDESTADEVGLLYLIRAGYDPYEAPELWSKMAQLSPDRPPEWQSTHPDPANREARLRELIPDMVARVEQERARGDG